MPGSLALQWAVVGLTLAGQTRPTESLLAATELTQEGTTVVRLTNGRLRLEIVPARGGLCRRLDLVDGSWALEPPVALLADVFTAEAMEKGPAAVPYVWRVVRDRPEQIAVELEATLDAQRADAAVAGLTFRRRIGLAAGRPYVDVEQTLVNPQPDPMGARVGVRHQFRLGPVPAQEVFLLPTERNVLRLLQGGIDNFYARTGDWEYRPVAGWAAAVSLATGQGLVCVLDDQRLDAFYASNATGTLGWFVDGDILDPRAVFTTRYTLFPLLGFPGVAHASGRFIADIQVKPAEEELTIVHRLVAGREPLEHVRLKTLVWGARSGQSQALADVAFDRVGEQPVSASLVRPGAQTEPLVIRVEAAGKDWKERYETYYEGAFRTTIYPGYPWNPEYRRKRPDK